MKSQKNSNTQPPKHSNKQDNPSWGLSILERHRQESINDVFEHNCKDYLKSSFHSIGESLRYLGYESKMYYVRCEDITKDEASTSKLMLSFERRSDMSLNPTSYQLSCSMNAVTQMVQVCLSGSTPEDGYQFRRYERSIQLSEMDDHSIGELLSEAMELVTV